MSHISNLTSHISNLMSNISPLYDESLKVLWDNYSIIETAKEEGRLEGREEGKEESRIKIAMEMKRKGYSESEIIAITGLSKDVIEKLD